jgi:hypothetical protein
MLVALVPHIGPVLPHGNRPIAGLRVTLPGCATICRAMKRSLPVRNL